MALDLYALLLLQRSDADSWLSGICTVAIIIAAVLLLIGLFPYIVRTLKAGHAVADSASDLIRSYQKPKPRIMKPLDTEDGISVSVPSTADLTSMFDFSALDNVYEEIESNLNRRTPVTIWGRDRLNKKMARDNMKLEYMIDKFSLTTAMTEEAAKLEATIRYAPHKVKDLLDEKMIDAHYGKQLQKEQYLTDIDDLQHQREMKAIKVKLYDAEYHRYLNETSLYDLQVKAEANMVLAKTTQETERAELMKECVHFLKDKDFSEKLKTYIILAVFNPGNPGNIEFDDKLKDALVDEKKADTKKKNTENESMKQDIKNRKMKFKRTKKRFEDEDT